MTSIVRLDSATRNAPELLVKAESHKFDCSVIYTLRLVGKNLSTISGLQNCSNLTDLNLSGNSITKIEGLESLGQLRRLDLSSNQISEVGGIWHCSQLETLQLQDNKLADLRAIHLKELNELPALKALYLQNLDRTRQNGCCGQPGYKAAILQALPSLQNLDGERCPHSNNYAELAAEMEELVNNAEPPKQLEVPTVPPWLDAAQLSLDVIAQKDPDLDRAGVKLVKSLDECHALSSVLEQEVAKCHKILQESEKTRKEKSGN
uniref:Uncharacterized protein n=1 Tax=Dunaliella tertiolecta TaxID=3047 RepID=A0A7S3VTR7_DUNTE|mmetsp:Transcript_27316/g.73845  ORF Transcript_27316/g.73845 Transcript_27316/m.73845 type:complete len:263 (+) Transcript_27316:243-1031(+)|eukprot:CAMPEP_0202390418 /NCGR_PEP_ID=MMETSP1127-20130417/88523_1 /ASSEMBLY_ACC=CAM_ASM_000462 /TAXON_ID=3047 /ORGANISM="Dunaliella tertiolecta, Strain CCMP1320" /LENGTH=262 /DNA_ID=CAMNT_0048992599 /DNA_START=154 /DNA_END=942 /DNA_ORIENTATION=-